MKTRKSPTEKKTRPQPSINLADLFWIAESNHIEDIYDPKEDARSLKAWRWLKTQRDLNAFMILDLHKRIVLDQFKKDKIERWAGRWRRHKVTVGGRECPGWEHVPGLMFDWIAAFHWLPTLPEEKRAGLDTISVIKNAHVGFEKIHPFLDGNGRTGRMIMNWMRVRVGLEPLLIRASERWQYYEWFK